MENKKRRENVIHKLTLLETCEYRKRGLELVGKYTHEPPQFRNDLFEIFDKLSDDDLLKLYNLKITIHE
jgi:hypothetical protein